MALFSYTNTQQQCILFCNMFWLTHNSRSFPSSSSLSHKWLLGSDRSGSRNGHARAGINTEPSILPRMSSTTVHRSTNQTRSHKHSTPWKLIKTAID